MEAEAASPASSSEGVSSSEAFVIRVENLWHLYGGEEAQHSQGESPLSLALRAALDEASLTSKEKPDSPRKKARPSPALEGVSFAVPRGARVLVVGSNGAGKSTLLSILGGQTVCLASLRLKALPRRLETCKAPGLRPLDARGFSDDSARQGLRAEQRRLQRRDARLGGGMSKQLVVGR